MTLISNLFSAGIETSATVINWCFVYLLRHPEIQKSLYREIEDVVGTSRRPTLDDKPQMSKCVSFINEVLRHANIAPFAVAHGVSEDTMFRGYLIPKESVLIPNLSTITGDDNLFKNADMFDPLRFINEDGKIEGIDVISAFSIGKYIVVFHTCIMAS